ncbi:sodium-dependent transporter [Ruminococcus sp. OA3]|uniref:sodium-dependent transporter n=1 Tax=Ruminococcus sp. OA3 TaxID=2914164 RepID=UPI001F06A71F|nr:sodium-dependent transporter [Ruminococcus sp. OA3]MCH1981021.1 sodium-dependent transporter [Ruminococcus sp. OA3]
MKKSNVGRNFIVNGREQFKSRLGFLLLSAGCAIGIGNVWRFPYVVGQNGGGIFVLFYLLFLVIMGVPILSMEFAVGRASKKSPVRAIGDGNMLLGLFSVIVAAMNQSFFTLSLGIGAMAIFGSYLGKDKRLLGEAVNVAVLDTFVAIVAGLIIFPACFAFGVSPDSGPSLIFITLPNVFLEMAGGRIWGTLFFLFMSFAAFSTVIAVFENIIACCMEMWNIDRKKVAAINLVLIILLSLPCALGYNVLSAIQPLGEGSAILDLEDFIVSNVLLPLGSLVYLVFCTWKWGWGFKNYQVEANQGSGLSVPGWLRGYVTYVLPVLVLALFLQGILR